MATLPPKRHLDRTVVAVGLKETEYEGRRATALAPALATALTLALASAIIKRHPETDSYGGIAVRYLLGPSRKAATACSLGGNAGGNISGGGIVAMAG